MLGMVTGDYAAFVYPDYTSSTKYVFEANAIAIIEGTNRVEILSHLPIKASEGLELSSFVPD